MKNEIFAQLEKVKTASKTIINLSEEKVNQVLQDTSKAIMGNSKQLLEANQKDLDRMDKNIPKYDRLLLDDTRLQGIANDMVKVSKLKSPVHEEMEVRDLENNLHLQKVRVPLGTVGVIYEARPNVTFDVFALCFKSFNACVLKGGSDASDSNLKSVEIIQSVLKSHDIDPNVVYLAPSNRDAVKIILEASDFIDVMIPRGSKNLIDFVRENSKMPVIETGAGIVHTYFDVSGNLENAKAIVKNAKTRRVSVCNALDTLIINRERLSDLKELTNPLIEKSVEIFADHEAFETLQNSYPDDLLKKASEEDFGREFLSLKMSIKTVSDVYEAIDHIYKYSSKHSEAIIADDKKTIDYFMRNVDAACVYSNTSTAFTDGAQFGLGAEIGISTQKLHARGPMALEELTSYKWLISGNGQIRE